MRIEAATPASLSNFRLETISLFRDEAPFAPYLPGWGTWGKSEEEWRLREHESTLGPWFKFGRKR